MKPTDQVDDLLKRAGAEWRGGEPPAPEPDFDRITGGSRRSRKRWVWVPLAAAAGVAAVVSATLVLRPDDKSPTAVPPQLTVQREGPAIALSNTGPLVRPGTKVEASGKILAAPGKDPVFCAPLAQHARGYPPGQEPVPSCPDEFAARLHGTFDMNRVSSKEIQGVKVGYARVVGLWQRDRSIQVQGQGEPIRPPVLPTPAEPKPPCAEPAGGWPRKSSNIFSAPVSRFLEARKAQTTGPRVFYPYGRSRAKPTVSGIGVAHIDPKVFQREFEEVYEGNLCVYPVKLSRGDVERIQGAIQPLYGQELGIRGGYGDDNFVALDVLVLDERLQAALRPIGLEQLRVNADVKPVG